MQEENQSDKDLFEWTVRKAVWAIFLFVLAGMYVQMCVLIVWTVWSIWFHFVHIRAHIIFP